MRSIAVILLFASFAAGAQTITTPQQQRGGTAAAMTSNNPTLLAREIACETDTGKCKLGDGATAWNSLGYITIDALAWAAISSTPTTLAGYGITDAATSAQGSLADSALQGADIDTLSELNALLGDATLIDTADSRLSDSRDAISVRGVAVDSSVGSPSDGTIMVYRTAGTDWVLEAKPAAGSNPACADVTDSTAAGCALVTAANVAAQQSALNVEDGADVTDATNVAAAGAHMAGGTDVPIADGGTGQSTAQAAIDALTAVAGATNEYVLTKDTATGNATWKAAAGGGGSVDTSGTPAANDFARFTDADTIEGRSYAEVRGDLDLEVGTDFDAAGTDNSTNVSLAGAYDYFTISGQVITLGQVDVSDDTNLSATSPVVLTGDVLSLTQNAGTDVTADLEEEAQIGSTTVTGNAVDNAVLVGTGANAAAYATLPSCSDEAEVLGWNTTTGAWVCNADAGAGGGMTSWTLAGDTGGGQTIADGNTASVLGDASGIDTVDSATDTVTISFDPAEAEAGLEAVLDLEDMQGTAATAQIAATLTGKTLTTATITSPTFTITNSAGAAPTALGRFEFDTTLGRVVVGDGAAGTYEFPNSSELATLAGTASVTGAWTFTNATVQEGAVTAHEAALTITESQISDLAHTTDTNANTICTGTDVYLDGEGNCDTISASGEANTASNLGGGLANYSGKVSVDLQFNSFATADFDLAANVISIDDATWFSEADMTAAIGSTVQAYDVDLTTWAGITPSANAQSLVGAANYAAMRTLLDLEAGTDFYSIAAADTAFEGELNNSAGLRAALSDESGTGAAIFAGGAIGAATATTPAANDNDTSVATTAALQTELTAYATDTVTFTNKTIDADNNTIVDVPITEQITIADPDGTDDYIWFRAPVTLTVTGVQCVAEGTTPSITLDVHECTGSAGTTCTTILSSVVTCNGGNDAATVSDTTIASGNVIRWYLGTPTGTVDSLWFQLDADADY